MQAIKLGPKAQVFKRLDKALQEVRALRQRWDDRLTLKGLSLCKRYQNFGLELLADLEIVTSGQRYELCAVVKCAAPVMSSAPVHEDVPFIALRLVDCVHQPGNITDIADWHQQAVLIQDVQVVDASQNLIPSTVRLERPDYVEDFGSGAVYMSLLDGRFKVFRRLAKREVNGIGLALIQNHEINGEMVKGGPEVMDGVTDNRGEPIGESFAGVKHDGIAMRITLHDSHVRLAFNELLEDCVQVRDMAIGPFNL